MRVLGIDPSLTSLGYAYEAESGRVITAAVQPKKLYGPARLAFHLEHFQNLLDRCTPDLVAYEGYAMGRFAGGGRLADLGELGGVLKIELWARRIPILVVPPTSLKLFLAGKGNAKKPEVAKAIKAETGMQFHTDDEADAYGLWLMGRAYLDKRHRPRNRGHYRYTALAGCELVSHA